MELSIPGSIAAREGVCMSARRGSCKVLIHCHQGSVHMALPCIYDLRLPLFCHTVIPSIHSCYNQLYISSTVQGAESGQGIQK